MKRTFMLAAILCLVALAADDAAIAPKAATSLKPQAPNLEMDAITIPRMLSYQGKLTDTLGQPVPNGNYQLTFRLYTQPSGGSAIWTEAQTIPVVTGLFSALLGAVTPISSVPDGGALYLSLQVAINPELTPRLRIASSAYSYKADTANYALAGGTPEYTWVRGTPDSVLYTVGNLGIARGGACNMLYGTQRFTHVNLGVACTTGTSGQDYQSATVGGGESNTASGYFATVGGGYGNTASNNCASVGGGNTNDASGDFATVGGGHGNAAAGNIATVGGGESNTASNNYATAGGGELNTASFIYTTVGGGYGNTASGTAATVGGGWQNTAPSIYATVGGGFSNVASDGSATVGGGIRNTASGYWATVAGGGDDTSAADYSFTTNANSVVPDGYSNSAAFNGQTATASNQTRVGTLSKASGTFTIDHPLDPHGKILNHYFIEGPEMLNIYRGSVVLDATGRAEVELPGYFDALNRNPQVVLTGIGSSDVYLVEEVSGNRFTIGGKPGTKVNWIATGERKDVSAEITRRMMPVEQAKTGALAGRMLDDDFLTGCMDQLVREGKASGIDFRTAGGRQRYERMRKAAE